ncbi:oxidoreductase [Phytohabitans rumicis]|uniref:Oxidoreductase n=1 Tax=Phytohabitans rumicis TaxID=1076125 RepID=A0A6V8LJ19_9ACTN|nr:oxidoreductase [Phytohabitans rumicis]
MTGWGRTAATGMTVLSGRDDAALSEAVRNAGARGILARGLGRSYGDAACNAGGAVVDMTGRDRILGWDLAEGTVRVEAGVSLRRLVDAALQRGWFLPVLPGTGYVTAGGAIAADVHGKNHPAVGSLARHVSSVDLLTADAVVRTVGPADTPEVFHATCGGMGLTGLILRATLRLAPAPSAWLVTETERAPDLDGLIARLADGRGYPYAAAWLDLLARGGTTGRGVVVRGRHAARGEAPVGPAPARRRPGVPAVVPGGTLNRVSVRAFNEAWFRRAPRRRARALASVPAFFHPLDAVPHWNRLYGPRGFVQYQAALPFGAEPALRRLVDRVAACGHAPFLGVLKVLGAEAGGPLSFPMPGWTLALDLAATPEIVTLLDRLDELVAAAGGRVYLAKDARLRPDLLAAMYPRVDAFRETREQMDPRRVFMSNLARRLSL